MKRIILFVTLLIITSFATAQQNMELLGQKSYSQELSDIWGYTDEDGNEYALVGVYNGFSIVDVTDPANPVEIYFKEGPQSIWRDIKVWGDYAYVSNESNDGILIVDMSPLPGAEITTTTSYTGFQYPFQSIHNLYIDEYGKLYIFGADNGSGGAIICDLTDDPMNPVELGRFNTYYLHDGMARGDTLWGAAIYQGVLAAIDVSDPANPQIMGTASTPGQFTHNAWISQDGTHVFTTDEVEGGYITAYNVTDLGNITETDRIQSSPEQYVIPHNAHVKGDFIITSYYTDGVIIHDASQPDALIEVASYDTSPNYSGSGFNGCWGVYPYLPSGNIIASDIEEGLYILSTEDQSIAYVEGTVTDSITGDPLANVNVDVLGTDLNTETAFDGTYEFSTELTGTYELEFTYEEYATKILPVEFQGGEVSQLDVELSPFSYLTGTVIDSLTGEPMEDVHIKVLETSLDTVSASDGSFGFETLLTGSYEIQFSAEHFFTKTLPVNFQAGETVQLEVLLADSIITNVPGTINEADLSLYPTPFSHIISLDYRFESAANRIFKLYDTKGNLLLIKQISGLQGIISFGEKLAPGYYIVSIEDGKSREIKKILKY